MALKVLVHSHTEESALFAIREATHQAGVMFWSRAAHLPEGKEEEIRVPHCLETSHLAHSLSVLPSPNYANLGAVGGI